MPNPPVEKVRSYPLEAAVWENEGKDGSKFFSVTLTRSYKKEDPETGESKYHQTSQLRPDDLLLAGELLRLAWYKIRALEEKERG